MRGRGVKNRPFLQKYNPVFTPVLSHWHSLHSDVFILPQRRTILKGSEILPRYTQIVVDREGWGGGAERRDGLSDCRGSHLVNIFAMFQIISDLGVMATLLSVRLSVCWSDGPFRPSGRSSRLVGVQTIIFSRVYL